MDKFVTLEQGQEAQLNVKLVSIALSRQLPSPNMIINAKQDFTAKWELDKQLRQEIPVPKLTIVLKVLDLSNS